MLPLRDNIPSRTIPFVNYAMIAICTVVFIMQVQEKPGDVSLVERFGMIPARVQHPDAEVEIPVEARQVQTPSGPRIEVVKRPAAPSAVPPWMTMLTCIFLHGSFMHLLGNMWFLFIFGDNVEDRFGHMGYAVFYMLCGVVASLVHFVSEMSSSLPTIGASGAIAGIMGAYFVWYFSAKVQALLPLGIFTQIIVVPAPLFLGLWFLLQFFSGVGFAGGTESSGVAWWAHIGGFVFGAMAAAVLDKTALLAPKIARPAWGQAASGIYSSRRFPA